MPTIPTEDTQKRAKRTLEEFLLASGEARDAHLKEVEEWNKHYRVKASTSTYTGRAHTANPISHETVETIAPRIFEVLTENGQLQYEVEPVDGMIDEELVKPINALIDSDLAHADARQKLIGAIRYVCKYGTVVLRTPWKTTTRTRIEPRYQRRVDMSVSPPAIRNELLGYERIDMPIYSGVGLEIVDLKRCYLDPFEPDVDKAEGIAEEELVAFDDLKKEEIRETSQEVRDDYGRVFQIISSTGHYFNLDKVAEKLKGGEIGQEVIGQKLEATQTKDSPRQRVKIVTYHGYFDYDGDGRAENCIMARAFDDIIIRCEPSEFPSRPYLVARYIPLENQTYGLGVLEIISSTQKTINDMQNQIFDNVTMHLLNMFVRRLGCSIKDEDLEFKPFGVIDTEDPVSDLVALRPAYVTSEGWAGVNFLLEAGRSGTGATKSLQGLSQKYHTTATEVGTMTEQSYTRFVFTAIVLETEIVVPLLRKIILFNREFMGPQKLIRITNDETGQAMFNAMTPEQLAGEWDFRPLGASNFQRLQKRRQDWRDFLDFIGRLGSMPLEVMAALGVNFPELLRQIAQTFTLPSLDRVIPQVDPQQSQQMLQMLIMQQNMPAAATSKNGENGSNGNQQMQMMNPIQQFMATMPGGR